MASSDIDSAQLNESQQLALQTYTSVTNQEPSAGIPLLQRSQWNVQIAIAKFFDGETSDPVAEAQASFSNVLTPQQANRRETLLNGSPTPRSSISSNLNVDPAPRIVPQPETQVSHQAPVVLSLLFAPFNIIYRLITGSLGFFGYLFPFLPRLFSNLLSRNPGQGPRRDTTGRRPLNPRDTAGRFMREFEEEYGSHTLTFFENGYAQALDMAKRDLKFLLVVLISPEHDDNSSFIRETLLSSEVVNYINNSENNIILWAGSVQDSEAYQVSNALRCTKFPFAALIVHTSQHSSMTMSVVSRITGLMPPTAFVAKLQTAVNQHSGGLDRARATRAEQEASRSLREEQNSAYERSLAQDRERARQRREAEAAKARTEREAKEKFEAEEKRARDLLQWKRWRARSIPGEPHADIKDAVRISVRMPTGERVVRKFAPEDQMAELYAFVECYDVLQTANDPTHDTAVRPVGFEHEYGFRLISPMPRTVYESNVEGTIKEHIGRSGNIIVESILESAENEDHE